MRWSSSSWTNTKKQNGHRGVLKFCFKMKQSNVDTCPAHSVKRSNFSLLRNSIFHWTNLALTFNFCLIRRFRRYILGCDSTLDVKWTESVVFSFSWCVQHVARKICCLWHRNACFKFIFSKNRKTPKGTGETQQVTPFFLPRHACVNLRSSFV